MSKNNLSLEQVVEQIKEFVNKGNINVNFGARARENVSRNAKRILKDIEELTAGKEIDPTEEDIKDTIHSCHEVLKSVILETLDDEFKDFIIAYSLLIFNWNTVVDDHEIKRALDAISNLIEFQNSMVSTAYLLKHLAKEFEAMQHFNPPSYRVARGYLETLSKRLEEEANECSN